MVPYFYIVPCEEPMLFTSKFFLTILVCCENPYMGSRKDNNIKNTLFISLSFWGFYLANIQNKNQKDSFFSQKFTLLCETLYEGSSDERCDGMSVVIWLLQGENYIVLLWTIKKHALGSQEQCFGRLRAMLWGAKSNAFGGWKNVLGGWKQCSWRLEAMYLEVGA